MAVDQGLVAAVVYVVGEIVKLIYRKWARR